MTARLHYYVIRKRKNRTETALKAFESPIRCGSPVFGLGSGVGLAWNFNIRSLARSASYFPDQKRQTATATCDPWGDCKISDY